MKQRNWSPWMLRCGGVCVACIVVLQIVSCGPEGESHQSGEGGEVPGGRAEGAAEPVEERSLEELVAGAAGGAQGALYEAVLAADDSMPFWEEATRLEKGSERERVMCIILKAIAEEDIDQGWSLLEGAKGRSLRAEFAQVMGYAVRGDPEKGMAKAMTVLAAGAELDGFARGFQRGVMDHKDKQNPSFSSERLLPYLGQVSGDARFTLARLYGYLAGAKSLEAGIADLRKVEDLDLGEEVIHYYFHDRFPHQEERRLQMLSEILEHREMGPALSAVYLGNWAVRDRAEAARVAIREVASGVPESAVENMVMIWADWRPREAALHIKELPAGPGRDCAVSGMVSYLQQQGSTEEATEWVEAIGDPERRKAALKRMEDVPVPAP